MGKSKYGVIAHLVWDGGKTVQIPEEMGAAREDQLTGEAGERLSELAGRVCYDSLGKGRSSGDYHTHILQVGHFSVYEHHQITVFVRDDEEEGGRKLGAQTLMNRPGLFGVFSKGGVRLTFNPRVILDWDRWSDPEDGDAHWLHEVLRYYAEQEWPQIIPCPAFWKASDIAGVQLCSHRLSEAIHDEEKWISMFVAGSRGFSHELVRHGDRTAISQRSTRFVAEDESPWVDHPLVQEFLASTDLLPDDPDGRMRGALKAAIEDTKDQAQGTYHNVVKWLQKWLASKGTDKFTARKQARGAARGYLGNALYTELIFSASVGQWKRMLAMRACDGADGEIRAVFVEALKELQKSRYKSDFASYDLKDASDPAGQVAVLRT